MEVLDRKKNYPFLQGGGDMGELTRNFDWSATSVGQPDKWPHSLRTTVSNLLRSKFPMFLWWGEDLIQFYNDAYRPSLGDEGKHPGALGQKGKECWPEIWNIIHPLITGVQTTGESVWMEDQLVPIYRNGKLDDVYWTYSYSAVLDDAGKGAGVLVTCAETTEKIMGYRQLEESKDQLQFAIEATELATWDVNTLTGKFTGNERLKQWFGLPDAAEKNLAHALNAIAWQDRPRVVGAIHQALSDVSGGYCHVDYTIIHPVTGEERIVRAKGRVEFNKYKIASRFRGTLQDITKQVQSHQKTEEIVAQRTSELKGAQQSLLKANHYLQQIVDKFETALVALIPVVDNNRITDFRFNMANAAYSPYSGLSPEEIQGKKISDVFPAYFKTEAFTRYVETYETGKPNEWELHYNVDGLDVYLNVSVSKMDNELIVHFTDFTKLKNLQLDLLQKIKELERSNRNLEEFAYAASHDLKEPVRKVHFFGERLKERLKEKLEEEDRRYFERMDAASKRMGSLIDDLLSYSQIGSRPRTGELIDMNELVDSVLADMDLEIEQKGATITVDKLFTIHGQQSQLQQAFQNLIANSLKYNKPDVTPCIRIACNKVAGKDIGVCLPSYEEQKEFYAITVSDNGIGFEQKEAERIFNVFTRLHGMAEYGGSGIGLSIVRKVVENHHGYITAEGEPDKGAAFKMFLPAG